MFDVKGRREVAAKVLDFRHFSASDHLKRGREDNRSVVTYQSEFEAKM